MSASINIEIQGKTLYLTGILDSQTLELVWAQYLHFSNIAQIDVSALTRVDSSGLALLTYLCLTYNARLLGATSQLQTLIELYDLQPVVLVDSVNMTNSANSDNE